MKTIFKNILTTIFTKQAKAILNHHKPIIVAVVGSVGKTSTKHAIASVLRQKYRVKYQDGNYNVPLTLSFVLTGQKLPNLYNPLGWLKAWLNGQKLIYGNFPYEVVLLELGTDSPGNIVDFKDLFIADIAVVAAISEEHMENFSNLEAVAQEELSIAQFSRQILVNIDDSDRHYVKMFTPNNSDITTYGYDHSAKYKLSSRRNNHHSFNVEIKSAAGRKYESVVNVAAKHNLKPIAAAVAVGDILGLTPTQIQKGIGLIKPAPGRMNIFNGISNSIVIDDTYNSSPIACEAALNALYEMKAPQKIAILGSMNELGAVSKIAHQKIGELCRQEKLDLLITLGEDANKYIANKAEENSCNVIRTSDPVKAGKVAAQNLKEGAIILAKGSQNGVFAEEAVKQLLVNPSDINNLVRQEDAWMAKKAKQFNY